MVFIEQNVNATIGARYNRWWAAYGAGGSVGLPLVMADSGHQFSTGVVAYSSVYRGMVDAELARPAAADVAANAWRVGSRYRVSARVVNRSGTDALGRERRDGARDRVRGHQGRGHQPHRS